MKEFLLVILLTLTIIGSSIAIYFSIKKSPKKDSEIVTTEILEGRLKRLSQKLTSVPEIKISKKTRHQPLQKKITTKRVISRPEKKRPIQLISPKSEEKKEEKLARAEQVVQVLRKGEKRKPVQLKEREIKPLKERETFSEEKGEISLKPVIVPRHEKKQKEQKIQKAEVPSTNTVAILPFENFTDEPKAIPEIMPVIKEGLIKKGFEIITEGDINAFLCSKKVRGPSFITNRLIREAGKTLGVKLFLTGSVIKFHDSNNPTLGLTIKLIDPETGRLIWADYQSSTGEDFSGLLMLGKIETMRELIQVVVDRLLSNLDKALLKAESHKRLKIAVLPFKNVSKYPEAGMIVTELFTVSLFKSGGFEPVIPGDIKNLMVNLKIRHRGEINYKGLSSFAKILRIDAVITGTVLEFTDPVGGSSPPIVSISARILDPAKEKILWYDHMRLDGDEKIIAFDWGKMRSVDMVAGTVVSELVRDINHIDWDKKIN